MRGTTLALALELLKTEIGVSVQSGTAAADDIRYYSEIDSKQRWLVSKFQWPFLKQRVDVSVSAGTSDSTRYQNAPSGMNFEWPVKVLALFSTRWREVKFGIGEEQYNSYSQGDGGVAAVQADPIQRWDWKAGDSAKIEIWPLPATATTLRFEGQKNLTTLKTGSLTFNAAATLDLDDLLVVYYAAAELLKRMKHGDADMKLAMADDRLRQLRANYPSEKNFIVRGSKDACPQRFVVPITTIS